jgi:hypothetical protein
MKMAQFMKENGGKMYAADTELFHGGKIAQFDTKENGKTIFSMDLDKCHGQMEVFMTDHGNRESARAWAK